MAYDVFVGKLDGKVALITGGARGMGEADAVALAGEGARVVICDLLDDEGAAVAAKLNGVYHHLDVTSESDWSRVIAATESTLGKIDILVNNAGILDMTPIENTSVDAWDRIIGVNLTGPFLGIRAVVPSMRAAGGGVIVNVSSAAGLMGYSNLAAYVSSKWGLRGLTKAAALDLGKHNIRVVSVHPGGVRTPMTAGMEGTAAFATQPIPRIGEPEEIAKLVLYLVADATYSTGTEFTADGGSTVGQVLPG
jgi:3alpha(or 20beta)-hydroxysteroid dehydrogenase